MKTLIILILDESGSMDTKKQKIIEGFNGFIAEQKLIKEDIARLYLVKFNSVVNTIYDGINLNDVPDLSALNYTPSGRTALYDAIAVAVGIADKDKTEDERVICVIMTDGQENYSRETTLNQVKDIITGHTARGDWTFLYIGEKPERWVKETGMSSNHGIGFDFSTPQENFVMASTVVEKLRSSNEQQSSEGFKGVSKAKTKINLSL